MVVEVPNGVYMDSSYQLFYAEGGFSFDKIWQIIELIVFLLYFLGASQYDRLPEELKSVAHEYWGTFPPQHPLIADVFAIFLFLSWIINFTGNFCVLFVFLTTKELRTAVIDERIKSNQLAKLLFCFLRPTLSPSIWLFLTC